MRILFVAIVVAISTVFMPVAANATRSVPVKQYRCEPHKPRCGLQVRKCAIVKVKKHKVEKSCTPWRYVKNA